MGVDLALGDGTGLLDGDGEVIQDVAEDTDCGESCLRFQTVNAFGFGTP